MHSRCWIEPWLNWVFIPLWTLLIQVHECWTPSSSEINIIKWREESKNYCKITNLYKILLLFLVWMNFLKMIETLSKELEKYRNSCHNLSLWVKSSLDLQEDLSHYKIQLLDLKPFWMELVMNIPKIPSIWWELLKNHSKEVDNSPNDD